MLNLTVKELISMQEATSTEQRSTGFTLIELLIVISIISVLAAILFPVFARARENARRTSCMSNLKQIGMGVLQYTQDYDEKFPPYWNGRTGAADVWGALIYPYVKNTQVFYCPSSTAGFDTSKVPERSTSTYGMNAYLSYTLSGTNAPTGDSCRTEGGCYGASLAAMTTTPSEIILAADRDNQTFVKWRSVPLTPRHLIGTNICYADGHVKWHKYIDSDRPGLASWYPFY